VTHSVELAQRFARRAELRAATLHFQSPQATSG
jgi:hypothetical protein